VHKSRENVGQDDRIFKITKMNPVNPENPVILSKAFRFLLQLFAEKC